VRLGSIRLRPLRAAGLAAVVVTMAAGATAGLPAAAGAVARPAQHQAPHVMTIMMENTDYTLELGSLARAERGSVARRDGLAVSFRHPGLPAPGQRPAARAGRASPVAGDQIPAPEG
jgi:hypothetical protein